MQKKNLLIILCACLVTALAVGYEVNLWQRELNPGQSGFFGWPIGNTQKPSGTGIPGTVATPVTPGTANFDEIKTKEQGIAACETNRAYWQTNQNTEAGQMALAIVNYCYSVIAGKFNDLSLCKKTISPSECEKTANEFIQMGKEMQNLTPEEREQLQKYMPNLITK
jgi:hypothetical protein